jgi:putative hydrolase of the HAD superfamily
VSVPVRAVLFDALGTLVELQPPAPRLRAALERTTGVDVGDDAAARGFGAEIAFYLANHMRGSTREGVERVRDDCARELHAALGVEGLDQAAVRQAMIDALEFTAYPDAPPALRALRDRGLAIVVVSNWDVSLAEGLGAAGLGGLVDVAISSAEVGVAKPSPEPFLAGLAAAGVGAQEAVYVGDSPDTDVAGARAAGLRPVLVARGGEAPPGVETVHSLEQVPSLF